MYFFTKVLFLLIINWFLFINGSRVNEIKSTNRSLDFNCPKKCMCLGTTVRCMFLRLDKITNVSNQTTIFDLRFNNIHDIPEQIFKHLNELTTLLLNNNKITKLQNNVFDGLKQKLRYLYLYKNRITFIGEKVFQDFLSLEQLYLNDNSIKYISVTTFTNVPRLNRLFLQNNKLERLEKDVFKNLVALNRLRLDSNALICDCHLLWLIEMIQDTNETRQISATCQNPSNFYGTSLNAIQKQLFNHCKKPEILEHPKDLKLNRGEPAFFTCKATLIEPKPKTIWYHSHIEVIPKLDKIEIYQNNSTLVIKNVDDDDSGDYECLVKNEIGIVKSKSAKLIINDDFINNKFLDSKIPRIDLISTKKLKRQQNNDYLNYYTTTRNNSIHFTRLPQDQDINLGDQVHLECSAEGNPQPRIIWSRNGIQLQTNPHLLILPSGDLVIYNAQRDDFGSYRCEAVNSFEKISHVAQIRINEAPIFTIYPENQTLHVGDIVEIECEASGSPLPKIKWFKNNLEVNELANQRVKLTLKNTRLLIKNLKETDFGEYLCNAENSLGKIETKFFLILKEERKSPAKIRVKPFNMEPIPGTTIELPCRAEGIPQPEYQWKKDGSQLDRFQFRYKPSLYGSLFITNVSLEDIGTFECEARNDYGRDTARAVIRVKDERVLRPGDKFVRVAFAEAKNDIDKAINNTIDNLLTNKHSTHPSDLFRIIRFPDAPSRELARAAEIYERTLINIRKHLNNGMRINSTQSYNYQDILSQDHLELVAQLSGCMTYPKNPNCTDMCFHLKYRSINGVCNNLQNPTWGAASTAFKRLLPSQYENGFSQPIGWDKTKKYFGHPKPAARLVSTKIISTATITPDETLTHMVMQWGQFLDHDLDHATPSVSSESWDGIDCKKSCEYQAPCFPMEVPNNDPRITNRRCIDFIRSSAVCGSGMTSVFFNGLQPREQINQLTSYIDASQVYGYSDQLARNLRDLTTEEGLLREGFKIDGVHPLLPYSDGSQGVDCRRDPEESEVNCFAAGDIRANEQLGLTAMHTIWFREHNRLARQLKQLNLHWTGEQIYQEARKIVGAQMQHITYKHWLPYIIGEDGINILGEYKGYNPNVNPTISNAFATAALRFGHSMINPILNRLNSTFQSIPQGPLPLHKAFFTPWRLVEEGGIDPLIRGLFHTPAKLKTPEENLNEDLTEKLFTHAHAVSLDLAAMNIQRSRDHALPGYLEYRKEFCGFREAIQNFDDLKIVIKNDKVRNKLKELYGHPGNIDVWVGGILEDQLPGAKIGPLFRCILIDQFKRLRDGDRFWYENPSVFKLEQLIQIKQATLSRVLCDNGDNINHVTNNVFILPDKQNGDKQNVIESCDKIPKVNLKVWSECCDNTCQSPIRRFRRNLVDEEKNNSAEDDDDHHQLINETIKIGKNKKLNDSMIIEDRLEGIEEAVEVLEKRIRHLTHQLKHQQKLINDLKKDQLHHHHNYCFDQNNVKRLNGEIWHKDNNCTKCQCEKRQINCVTKECPNINCQKPIRIDNQCCLTCTDNQNSTAANPSKV